MKKHLSKTERDKQWAKEYGCDDRTIRRYRSQGAPLDDREKMAGWLAEKHCIPSGSEDSLSEYDSIKDLSKAKVARLVIQCKRDAHKLALEKRQSVPASEVRESITKLAADVEKAFDTIVADCPNWSGLTPAKMQERVRKLKDAAVEQFHRSGKEYAQSCG